MDAQLIVSGVDSPGGAGVTELSALDTKAATAAAATLGSAVDELTWLSGFYIDGLGATAGSVIEAVVIGILGGNLSYEVTIPAGVGVAIDRLVIEFSRPLPAIADNTTITVAIPSFGVGNTRAIVYAHGFRA